ncbi:MAG: quinolinate synthase NadA [Pseudomonadota bacterium]|nr:quinolinate synthase NadA [Pseudomonadota bacterium]
MINTSLNNNTSNITKNLSERDQELFYREIPSLLKKKDASLIAHYYTPALVQLLAERTGGIVADSLEMARFGKKVKNKTLIVAGVYFMGESAKLLSPAKKIYMPDINATCSLDLSCNYDDFKSFISKHPDRKVVVYANTSAKVRSLADWVVTSRNAIEIVNHLATQGQKILWAPDKYLGNYIKNKTNADMLIWQGECIVHSEFKIKKLLDLKSIYPDAAILVHPESPMEIIDQADVVGSTSILIDAVTSLPNDTFIIATDKGIFYKMQQLAPSKTLIPAPTAEDGANCRACASCPWMALNTLESLYSCLKNDTGEIYVATEIIEQAAVPMQRMVDFNENIQLKKEVSYAQ